MDYLLTTKLFNLINEQSHLNNQTEFESAYEELIEQVKSITGINNNYIEVIRFLNLTRIEFIILEAFPLSEQGEKCAKEIYYKSKITYRIGIKSSLFTNKISNNRS